MAALLAIWDWFMNHGIVGIVAFNTVLSAVKYFLGVIGVPVPAFLTWIIDFITANLPHSPDKPAEVTKQ